MTEDGVGSSLAWLVDELVGRVKQAQHAVVLTADGLLLASSRLLGSDDADHLAATAAGVHSLAKAAGAKFGDDVVRQTIIEMRSAFLFVSAAGDGACLAVLATEDVEPHLIAYEMAILVTRVGAFLAAPARTTV
ncbi:roadblock/LC7 domain-containing protein [Micromonospora sp. NPDC094482]|uniref:roadblock/LC7 domain-containing protein n=1 Tax=unclassified Micromonospora TaxID=2617518 RepID=UPI00332CF91D